MSAYYQAAEISKSGHRKAVQRLEELDNRVVTYMGFIDLIRKDHPMMGLRAMYNQFQPAGIGRDTFIALGMQQGYRLRQPHNPMITTRAVKSSRYANLLEDKKVTGVNQVWVSDLFYYPCQDQHYYGVLIMDVYSRRIVGYSMANNMRAEETLAALTMALTLRGVTDFVGDLIHHSDRGSQYVSHLYTDTLDEAGIQISMCATVLENAHAERVNGTIKNQYLAGFDTSTPKLLIRAMDRSVIGYNSRGHLALNGMTPVAYEAHLKSIPMDKRVPLTIFTESHFLSDQVPPQLSLFVQGEN